jgi:hypothetical protein
MNEKTNRHCRLLIAMVAAAAALTCVPTHAIAGKVNMPKEGSYELRFCTVGDGTVPIATENIYVTHYSGVAVLNAHSAGGAFDRQSARCWGTLGIIKGKASHLGYCEVIDEDGDKWLMEYFGKADNSGGNYTAVNGTGKYEGMTLKGEYKLDFYPALSPTGYSGCHANKGTYRLK